MYDPASNPPTAAGRLDPSLRALSFLLRRYGRTPSAAIAGEIADQIDALLADPEPVVDRSERLTYRRMHAYWRLLASRA